MTSRLYTLLPAILAAFVCATMMPLSGCASDGSDSHALGQPHHLHDDAELRELAANLTGWFDSADQAADDPDNYFNIRLVMVPVWTERTDGYWLYVEQAADAALDRPYRQRVYRVHRAESGMLHSDVFTLPGDPLEYAGAWHNVPILGSLTPDDLEPRDGCTIVFEPRMATEFVGATIGRGCASTLAGATFATSSVRITHDLLTSWDRGWNDAGEQVWGATDAPYHFVRRGDHAP